MNYFRFLLIKLAISIYSEPQSTIESVDLRISRLYPYAANPLDNDLKDGDIMDYAFVDLIGKGAFSEVYLGYRHSDNMQVVLKNIQDSKMKVIDKEIRILLSLRNCPYTLQLIDYIRANNGDSEEREATLVFPYNNTTISLSDVLSSGSYDDKQIKRYFYQLFYALDQAHQRGVMHRDVKGSNILVNDDDIILIDWGLSAYYIPLRDQSCKMGTRYYKAPELLLGYRYYDYGIDIWAAGMVLADYIFQVHPLLKGKDNVEQLSMIVEMLGTRDFLAYIQKYNIDLNGEYYFGEEERLDLNILKNRLNENYVTPEAIDLLNRIFVYDHQKRITAKEILNHPYFSMN